MQVVDKKILAPIYDASFWKILEEILLWMTLKQKAMILIFVQKFLSQTKKLRKLMFDLLAMDTPWGTKRRGKDLFAPTRPSNTSIQPQKVLLTALGCTNLPFAY